MQRQIVIGIVVAAFAGCEGQDVETAARSVSDSVGVRIVEYASGLEASSRRASVEPIFVHGSRPGAYLFQTIWAGVLQPDGGAVVYDMGSQEILLLGAEGVFRAPLATQGAGPDEVRRVMSLSVLGQDTILVEDDGNARLAVFTPDGVLSSVSTAGDFSVTSGLRVHGIESENRLLMGTSAYHPGFEEPWFRGHMAVFSLPNQQVDTIGTFDLAPRVDLRGPVHPFLPRGTLTAAGGMFVHGRSDNSELRWTRSEGRLAQVLRWQASVEYPTAEDMQERADRLRIDLRRVNPGLSGEPLEAMIQRSLERYEVYADMPLPLWNELKGDALGRTWIAEFTPAGSGGGSARYFMIGPAADRLSMVEFPSRVRLLDASRERVLVVQRDEMDVEHVAVYRLGGLSP